MAVCKGCGKLKAIKLHLQHNKRCATHYPRGAKKRKRPEVLNNLEEWTPPVASTVLLLCDANSLQFHEELKDQMLNALNSWTTKAMVGAKWKNVVKQDVQRGIDTAVADIEKELVKECGNEQGGALTALVRDRLQLFAGLRTERQELSALRHRAPPFEVYARKVGKAPSDIAYCTMIADWLDAKMKMDNR